MTYPRDNYSNGSFGTACSGKSPEQVIHESSSQMLAQPRGRKFVAVTNNPQLKAYLGQYPSAVSVLQPVSL